MIDGLSLMTIPNFIDQILFLRKQRASIADLPLYIHFQNSLKIPDPAYDYYRNGFRQTSETLISPCASVLTLDIGIDIILRYPRITCQYLPHRKCFYDDAQATVLLLNHELMHSVLDHIGEPLASEKWDSPSIVKKMAEILPDCFCHC